MKKKSKCACNLKGKMYQNANPNWASKAKPIDMSQYMDMSDNNYVRGYANSGNPLTLDEIEMSQIEAEELAKKKQLAANRGQQASKFFGSSMPKYRDIARTIGGMFEDARVRRTELDMMYDNFQPMTTMLEDKHRYGLNQQEAFFQTGGDIKGMPMEMAADAEVFVEPNEMIEFVDGSLGTVGYSGATNVDHGDHPTLPGTPLSGVNRVLEATSTKRGRTALADKVLQVTPDMAEQIVGFRPKTTVSHATLANQAIEYYNKKRKRFISGIEKAAKYPTVSDRAENSIKLNGKHAAELPTDEQIFDAVYNHQEAVKEMFGIEGVTQEQLDNYEYPIAQYGGQVLNKLAQTGERNWNTVGGLRPDTNYKQGYNPSDPAYRRRMAIADKFVTNQFVSGEGRQFQTVDDIYEHYRQKGYPGNKNIGELQKWMYTNHPEELKTYLNTVALNNKGRQMLAKKLGTSVTDPRVAKGTWNDLGDDATIFEAFNDGLWDYRMPKFQTTRYSGLTFPAPANKKPQLNPLPITPPPETKLPPEKTTPPPKKTPPARKPFWMPLEWYDTAAAENMWFDSLNRDLEPLIYPERHQVQLKRLDPTAAVNNARSVGRANARNFSNNPVGYGMRSQNDVNTNRAINETLNQYENQNAMITNDEIKYNAGVRDDNSKFQASGILNFNDRVMQGRAKQSLARQKSIEGYANAYANNRAFNLEMNMMMPRNFTIDENTGMIMFTGTDNGAYPVYTNPANNIADYTAGSKTSGRRTFNRQTNTTSRRLGNTRVSQTSSTGETN